MGSPLCFGTYFTDYRAALLSGYPKTTPIPIWISPSDPSLGGWNELGTAASYPISYCSNLSAFVGPPRIPASYPDGTSQTLMFAERYWYPRHPRRHGPYVPEINSPCSTYSGPCNDSGSRRATFADASFYDALPVTAGSPPVTRPSIPGVTFQVRPRLDEADNRMLQTPYSGGLVVALFDGSVRTIRSGVAEEVFWAAVTPAGGEVATLD